PSAAAPPAPRAGRRPAPRRAVVRWAAVHRPGSRPRRPRRGPGRRPRRAPSGGSQAARAWPPPSPVGGRRSSGKTSLVDQVPIALRLATEGILDGVPSVLAPRLWAGHLLMVVLATAALLLGLWQLDAWQTRR